MYYILDPSRETVKIKRRGKEYDMKDVVYVTRDNVDKIRIYKHERFAHLEQ